jgi:hypothetical protein
MAIQMFLKTAEEELGHEDNVENGAATGNTQLEPLTNCPPVQHSHMLLTKLNSVDSLRE